MVLIVVSGEGTKVQQRKDNRERVQRYRVTTEKGYKGTTEQGYKGIESQLRKGTKVQRYKGTDEKGTRYLRKLLEIW